MGEVDMQTPFPEWLTEFTNLTQWPGIDPPYIPLDYINLTEVPGLDRYILASVPKFLESSAHLTAITASMLMM